MTVDTAWTAPPVDETIREEDAVAIRTCVLDYFEGWFEGDADRMDRATLWRWATGHGPRA
jgi:hypothetical protein